MNTTPDDLIKAMSCFATGVTVITTTHNGQDLGMTCNSFNVVSRHPPLVLWSLRHASPSRIHFEQAGGYTVNVLAHAQQNLVMQFANGPHTQRFADVAVLRLPCGRPIIQGATAWFDCQLETIIPAGDHHIMLGRVLDFGWQANTPPLIYAQQKFGMLAA